MDKPEDVWQKAMENALVYGTGFVRFDSMGGISVVDPKDYHYLEKKEWVGLTDVNEMVETELTHYCNGEYDYLTGARDHLTDFAQAIEAKLKEKNS